MDLFYLDGAACGTAWSNSGFTGDAAADYPILYRMYHRKYASSTDYLSFCKKGVGVGL